MKGRLKQIGVGSGAVKHQLLAGFTVNKKPIRFNVAFPFAFVVSLQRMVIIFCRKRLVVNKKIYYSIELAYVLAALYHQLALFFERAGIYRNQHGLIVSIQIRHHFFERAESFCRYLAAKHRVPFFKSRLRFSVKAHFARFRVAVLGAQGAAVVRSRGKGKDNRPRWYFAGDINSQPTVSRDFYCLCNDHKESIA